MCPDYGLRPFMLQKKKRSKKQEYPTTRVLASPHKPSWCNKVPFPSFPRSTRPFPLLSSMNACHTWVVQVEGGISIYVFFLLRFTSIWLRACALVAEKGRKSLTAVRNSLETKFLLPGSHYAFRHWVPLRVTRRSIVLGTNPYRQADTFVLTYRDNLLNASAQRTCVSYNLNGKQRKN